MVKKFISMLAQIVEYKLTQDTLKAPKYLKKPKGTNEETVCNCSYRELLNV